MAMPFVERGTVKGLLVHDIDSREEETYRHDERLLNDCHAIRLAPRHDVCAVVYGWQGTVNLGNLQSGERRSWTLHKERIKRAHLAFGPRAESLAVYYQPADGESGSSLSQLEMWSLGGPSPKRLWGVSFPRVYAMNVNKDGTRLAIVAGDAQTTLGVLVVFAASGEIESRREVLGSVVATAPGWCEVSLDAGRLVIVRPGIAHVYDLENWAHRVLPLPGRAQNLNLSVISLDQMRLIGVAREPPRRYPLFDSSRSTAYWISRWDLATNSIPRQ